MARTVAIIAPLWMGSATAAMNPASSVLWYDHPAQTWMTEALPLGNGSLGGMLFGRTDTERLQFNHNTLWTGDERETGSYQAFGEISIQLDHGNPSEYRRELNVDAATLQVVYQAGGVRYERQAFASHPGRVLVYRFTADRPGAYTGRLRLTDAHGAATVAGAGNRLVAAGRLGADGLDYEAQVALLTRDGNVRLETAPAAGAAGATTCLAFAGCSELAIVLAAGTNYLPDATRHWRGEPPHRAVDQCLDGLTLAALPELYAAHVADYQPRYRRWHLELGRTAPEITAQPTDRRLLAYTKQRTLDPDLEELFVNYGRYLLISSSRAGGLPANLQGLWNDSNNPPWRSDYHSNINVEMNYWLAEPTNLADCHRPLLDYIASQVPVYRQRTREKYGPGRGWTVHTENGIFGGGTWKWNMPGSAWYAQHFWEHYAFGLDSQYLRELAYPLLKEVCEYWVDRLVTRADGTVVTPVGWSPEHGPEEEAVTYDLELVYDLFTNYLEAAATLDRDPDFRARVADLRARMLKPRVGKWGQLQEWEQDKDDPKDDHRHVSHLLALHPGRQITATGTPALFQAARVSLQARGDGGTGWSRAWKIAFWARLQDGDHAYLMLRQLLTAVNSTTLDMHQGGGIYPNLFDAHPPFQIDGNFGAVAGVAEMLVQSHAGAIVLLPALPAAWPTGSVTGMRARGGFELDLSWQDGSLTAVTVRSQAGGRGTLCYRNRTVNLNLAPGAVQTLGPDLQ